MPRRSSPSTGVAAHSGRKPEASAGARSDGSGAASLRDHAVLAAALDPIITIDARGVIQSASNSVQRVFGWSPGELVGRNVSVLMPDPHRSAHDGYLANYRRTGRTHILGVTREFEGVRKGGERFPLELSVSRVEGPDGAFPLFVGMIRDISERKRLEHELRLLKDIAICVTSARDVADARTEALRLICNSTGWDYGEVWVPAADGRDELEGVASWAGENENLAGFAASMAEHRIPRGSGIAGRAWKTGRASWHGDLNAVKGNEFRRCRGALAAGLRAAAAVPVVVDGEVSKVLLFFARAPRREDVHLLELARAAAAPLGFLIQRKRSDDKLRESEARLRLALQAARGSVWHWDLVTGEASWSDEMYDLWGVARGTRMRLENSLAAIHPDDREQVKEAVNAAISGRTDYSCEFRVVHPALGERWMASHGRLILDSSGEPVRLHGITMDITDRKRAQAELEEYRRSLEQKVEERSRELRESQDRLRLADRLASIGTLAAGLGHDMNNVLLPVRAHLNALRAEGEPPAGRKHLEEIGKSVAYLQQLADGLHFLAMDPDTEAGGRGGEITDLKHWWAQTGVLLAKSVPRHVRVTASFPQGLPPVALAPHRLTQAVLNLIVNAGEAVPSPAERKRRQGRVSVWAQHIADSGQVRLGVTDNGRGMPDEVKRRAFEMFFTTKTRGLGTGLGLALVNKVASVAGGHVEVESQVGQGTTVVMSLPAALPATGAASRGPRAVVAASDGRTAALIRQLLTAGGATVLDGESTRADIWVIEPDRTRFGDAGSWRRKHPDGRLVLLGRPRRESPAEWGRLGAITIDQTDDFEALRAGLSRALSSG